MRAGDVEQQVERFWADVAEAGDAPVVALHGELDVENARRLKALLGKLQRSGHRRIALDMRQVTFIDSSGVGVLAGVQHGLRERYGGLTLTGLTPRVFRIFCITGMDRVFDIEGVA